MVLGAPGRRYSTYFTLENTEKRSYRTAEASDRLKLEAALFRGLEKEDETILGGFKGAGCFLEALKYLTSKKHGTL